jgi:hypothetical protein
LNNRMGVYSENKKNIKAKQKIRTQRNKSKAEK